MSKSVPVRIKARSASDAAVDGLIAGLAAGSAMILLMVTAGFAARLSPFQILTSFGAGQAATPLGGMLVHLSVSAIYGALFGLLLYFIPTPLVRRVPVWLIGLLYAAVLLFFALGLILPEFSSPLANLPVWLLSFGHAAYGLVLGWRLS